MAVHFSSHVRQRMDGEHGVLVEVFIDDGWYEVHRGSMIFEDDVFNKMASIARPLIHIMADVQKLGAPIPRPLRTLFAHKKCRIQAIVFEYNTLGLGDFMQKYKEYISASDTEVSVAMHELKLRLGRIELLH